MSTGLLAGFVPGRIDRFVTTAGDLLMAMPGLVMLLVVLAVFQSHLLYTMIALGLLLAPALMRVVRAAVLSMRQDLYIDAARVAGLSTGRIIVRHVLPRVRGVILVPCALHSAHALLITTGLAYLGFGTQPPDASWGLTIGEASQVMSQTPWPLISSGTAIGLTVMAFGLLGDGLRDATVAAWTGSDQGVLTRREKPRPSVARSTAPPEPGALLSVRALTLAYPGKGGDLVVVRDADLDLSPGETLGLVGESGSGKTAVARAILGILRGGGRVVSGSITFDGEDLLASYAKGRPSSRPIAYVSQEPMTALDPTWRVGELIAESVRHHSGVSKERARARAVELLGLVRIDDPERVARRYPHELSGGMAQRVTIAKALAGDPRLLIADEVTTALDVSVQAEILHLLRSLQESTGLAILLITHDWGVVADLCDRAMVMYAGEIVEYGPVDAVFDAAAHPYTRALMAANPTHARDDQDLPAIPGTVPSPHDWPTGCHFAPRCPVATPECRIQGVPLTPVGASHAARCLLLAPGHTLQEVSS